MKPYSILGPGGDYIDAEGLLVAVLDGQEIGVHAEGPWSVPDLISALATLIMYTEKRVASNYPDLDLAALIFREVAQMKRGEKSVRLTRKETLGGKELKPSDFEDPVEETPQERLRRDLEAQVPEGADHEVFLCTRCGYRASLDEILERGGACPECLFKRRE